MLIRLQIVVFIKDLLKQKEAGPGFITICAPFFICIRDVPGLSKKGHDMKLERILAIVVLLVSKNKFRLLSLLTCLKYLSEPFTVMLRR